MRSVCFYYIFALGHIFFRARGHIREEFSQTDHTSKLDHRMAGTGGVAKLDTRVNPATKVKLVHDSLISQSHIRCGAAQVAVLFYIIAIITTTPICTSI